MLTCQPTVRSIYHGPGGITGSVIMTLTLTCHTLALALAVTVPVMLVGALMVPAGTMPLHTVTATQ